MTRYVTRAPGPANSQGSRAHWSDYDGLVPDIHVPETQPINTGLVDARGHSIMRLAPPIGFGRMEDW